MSAATPPTCPACGATGTLQGKAKNLTRKRRVKFGFTWLLLTILTGGLALILWLVWPRTDEVVGVDRYLECSKCHAVVV